MILHRDEAASRSALVESNQPTQPVLRPVWLRQPPRRDGAYSTNFHAAPELAIAIAWAVGLALAVYIVLRRTLGSRA